MTETKAGIPHFSGAASTIGEWKFKVMTKKSALTAIKDDDTRRERMAELTSKVTDGLAGEALKVAMDLGEAMLGKENGLDQLIEAMENMS